VLTMNSVKILHAIRSAITATAELLVIIIIIYYCFRMLVAYGIAVGVIVPRCRTFPSSITTQQCIAFPRTHL